MLDHFVNLLARLHGVEVEQLDDRSGLGQFRRVIGRWCELLDVFASHTGGRLLAPNNRAVTEITFDEEDHLFIADENFVAAHDVEPPLYRGLDARLVLIGADASRSNCRGNSRHEGLWVGRDQVLLQLDEFGVEAPDIAELSGAELGQVCLYGIMSLVLSAAAAGRSLT